jgi:glutaredoxin
MNPEDEYHRQLLDQTKDDYRIQETQIRQMPQKRQVVKRIFTDVKILLKDESKLTERLVDYFDKNLLQLNLQGFKFEWVVVTDDEEELYEDEGITKFPTLLINDENISGVSSIIKTLMNMIKFGADAKEPLQMQSLRSQPSQAADVVKQNDESIRDYFLNSITDTAENDEDLDEGTKFANDISSRMADMQENRKKVGMPSITSSSNHDRGNRKTVSFSSDVRQRPGPPKSKNREYKMTTNFGNAPISTNMVDIIKNNRKNSRSTSDEDSMLEKFYENLEETVLD